jgi:hypothetical protein
MDDEMNDDGRLDELLREALEPDPHTVRRVVRAALEPAPRRAPRLVWAAAAAGFIVAVGLIALSPWGRHEPPAPAPPQPEAIVISNQDGVLTVTTPSGCEWVSVGGSES